MRQQIRIRGRKGPFVAVVVPVFTPAEGILLIIGEEWYGNQNGIGDSIQKPPKTFVFDTRLWRSHWVKSRNAALPPFD
ncbi:hypothetical protein Y032_0292g1583 [Ancylostoma ceylanicum]|uniref:Uncharacterized protein n=1 Tax=Ancylostoma ceylanicum TaxID=53326 RepID=A0A016S5H0_9BILA|nr:hypothetical protein Y032_0292g1583 [Ancylostoma ceylanicum]